MYLRIRKTHRCKQATRRKKRYLGDIMLRTHSTEGIREIRSGVSKSMRGRPTHGGRANDRTGKHDDVMMLDLTIDGASIFDCLRRFFKTLLWARTSPLRSLFGLMAQYCREASLEVSSKPVSKPVNSTSAFKKITTAMPSKTPQARNGCTKQAANM